MKSPSTISGSRRALFARFRGGPEQIRPPWSRPETEFTEACTLCDACIGACPTGLLTKGHAGYPIADFARASCTLCGACADACKSSCFVARDLTPWSLKASIGSVCIEPKGVVCRICEESCPSAAITFKPKLGGGAVPQVDQSRCTGCGACVHPCPVKAIVMAAPSKETPT